jgi:hypothetical protein
MKKVFVWFLLLLFLLPVVAMAEQLAEVAVEVVASEIPTNPVTWEQLATIGGAAMATMLIVQLLKLPLDKVWKIPTRIIVFVIAFIVLILATYFTTGLTWSNALLTVINAVIVALTAMGGYELTFAKLEKKKANTEPTQT